MPAALEYHGYLDRFSILGSCVVAEGWANERDFALWYRDRRLTLSVETVARPDLVPVFGPESARWGFSLAAALPGQTLDQVVDYEQFRIRFNAGMTIDPINAFCRADDQLFDFMISQFRAGVRPGNSMLEIGSRARSGATYRAWFPERLDYVGLDVSDGPNVDVVGDAHHLSRQLDRKFDHVFSMATFEHILMPWKVALEMNRVMRPGGTALIISHGAWPLHEEPWDFFRFSTASWQAIFNVHTGFRVIDAQYQYGASIVPHYLLSLDTAQMSLGSTYLLSGCVVERTGDPRVSWDAEASDVYELGYDHR